MEEDWDAEIAGTSVPIKQFQEVKINNSASSQYFEDDYDNQQNDEHIGFGSHMSFEGRSRGGRGRGRGRGRGFDRQKTDFNWRNENNSRGQGVKTTNQTNGFGSDNRNNEFGSNNRNNEFGSNNRNNEFGSNNRNNGFGSNNRSMGFGSNNRNNEFGSNNRNNGFGSNNRSMGFGSNNRNMGFCDTVNDTSMLKINVLSEYVGKIIGRGGSKIKEIQAESGARLNILKDDSSLYETVVEIHGSPEQQQKAKQIVEDLTIPAGDYTRWAERENRKLNIEQNEPPKAIDWASLKRDAATYEIERWKDCPDIKKNFYKEKKRIACMDPLDVSEIRLKKNKITVQDLSEEKRSIPNPVLSFEDAFDDFPQILDTIRDNKFKEPSPIQSQAWPVLLSGMDCIGIAQTGTGKTLAFLLPAFIHIDEQLTPRKERGGPSCLVMSPTRELALQIEMEVKKFNYRGIRSICVYGGGDRREQINLLKQGVEIVIGTPGRLNDLLMNNFFTVKSVTYLVLDEADRMLDMGFEPEIKKILLDIRPDRQTVMTSATWPSEVQRMADQYLKNPVRVNVGSLDLQACHSVTQLIEFIEAQDKQARLNEFVESMGPDDKLIVFVGRKVTADDISCNFAMYSTVDIGIQSIHGDRDQQDREQALEDMKTGAARVLIATDVASRGLDIKDLTHVLNYDFPRHIEDYVHRIGRTGRAGRSGIALTFVTREDWMHVGKMIPILEEAGQEIPDELVEMAERAQKSRDRRMEERSTTQRPRGCFKCGKEGHMSRECPENGGDGGGGGGFRGGGRGGRGRRNKRGGGVYVGGPDFV